MRGTSCSNNNFVLIDGFMLRGCTGLILNSLILRNIQISAAMRTYLYILVVCYISSKILLVILHSVI